MTTTNTKAVAQALATSPEQQSMMSLINSSVKELSRALPKHLSPERLARIATTAVRQNPKLALCTQASLMGALFTSAQLGLEPVAGLAYLIPFSNNKCINGTWQKVLEVQFVIGYKGVADLFYRHEKSGLVDWGTVHEKDDFSYQYGTSANLKHIPASGERGKVIGYYVIFKLAGGFTKFNYMTVSECMEHGKKHSKTFDGASFNKNSPWNTSPDSMCLKTVLLQGAKTVPLATELRRALETDETSREFRDGVTDALDLPVTTWQEAEVEKEMPKADTSKVAEAIEDKTASTEKKQGYDDSGLAPNPTAIILKGLIAAHEQKGKGPSKFYVQGQYAQTFDKDMAETLVKHKEAEEEVELTCHEEKSMYKDKEYINIVIDSITTIVR